MPVSYQNRAGETAYIKVAKTKKGGTRYYIVKDLSKVKPEELLEEIPEGFEFYEYPYDCQIRFRKKIKSNITAEEFSILDTVMKNHQTIRHYTLDIEENSLMLYIYTGNLKVSDFLSEEEFRKFQNFDQKLRFEKNKDNNFEAQRHCFLSRYYGWITMETSDDLKYLAEKYCFHANRQSLLDFWIEGQEEPMATLAGTIRGRPVYKI